MLVHKDSVLKLLLLVITMALEDVHDAVQGHDVGADGQAHGRGAVATRVVDDDFTGVGHPRILAREHGHQPLLSLQEREHEDGLDGQIAVTAVNTVDDVVTDEVLANSRQAPPRPTKTRRRKRNRRRPYW